MIRILINLIDADVSIHTRAYCRLLDGCRKTDILSRVPVINNRSVVSDLRMF